MRQHLGQQRYQARVDDHRVVAGVGGDIADHLGLQARVEGVQNRAHGRDGQICLEMLGVVPHQRRDPLVAVDAERAERVRELSGLLPVAS